jgi:hypothetical protein
MKRLFHIGMLLCLAATAAAQEDRKVLKVYDWKDLSEHLRKSQVISMDGMSVLKIENTNNTALNVSVLMVTDPLLIAKAGAISCEAKYDDVRQGLVQHTNSLSVAGGPTIIEPYTIVVSAKLTILRYFQPEAAGGDEVTNTGAYPLVGTSNWKPYHFSTGRTEGLVPYSIPENSTGKAPPEDLAKKLEVRLSLPTNGVVYLRPIKLLAVERSFTGWWSPQQSGLIGGIGSSLIGCLGGLIGLLVSKGKARNFVLAAVKGCIALGILLTIAGLVAAVLKQTYDVWYALLLPGVILVLVFSLNLHSIQRRYDELEIRRMTSIDTTGS